MMGTSYILDHPQPLEAGIDAVLHQAEQRVATTYHGLEDRIRQSPTKAVLTAAAIGYCLHRLPVREILVAKVRLLSALAPPALLLLGAAKIYEFFQNEAAIRAQQPHGASLYTHQL